MRRHSEEEEPEWFSSGPTSQMDTIELHGFDGPDKHREEEEEEDEDMESESHTQHHGKHRTHLQQAREIAGNLTTSPFYGGIAGVSSISHWCTTLDLLGFKRLVLGDFLFIW